MNKDRETTLFKHCVAIYDAMMASADLDIIEGQRLRVFRGYTTEVFKEQHVPTGYYTPVKQKMEQYGCWTIIQSGARSVPSVIVLHKSPADVGEWTSRPADSPLTLPAQYAKLRSDVDGILISIGGLNLKDAMINMETRLAALETQLQENREGR